MLALAGLLFWLASTPPSSKHLSRSSLMVLGDLGAAIARALRNMNSAMVINGEVVDSLLKEIGNALVASDVNVMLVANMRKSIKATINFDDLAAGVNKRRVIEKV